MNPLLLNQAVDLDPSGAYGARAAARSSGGDELFGPIPADDRALVALAEDRRAARDPNALAPVWRTLEAQWSRLDLPEPARAHVRLLTEDPTVSTIIAGQQPALAGGTLLHWAKALSAVALAQRLTALGHPTVPLIWIADEDHDTRELFGGWHPRGDDLREVESPFEPGRHSIGRLRFPAGGAEVVSALRDLGVEDAPLLEVLAEHSDASPSIAFRDTIVHALAETGILPVHPAWLRELQRDRFADEVATPGRLVAEVEVAKAKLERAGIVPPIATVSELPLFWIDDDGARHRLDLDGDRWFVRGVADAPPPGFPAAGVPKSEASEWARSQPTRFSPDALLRPLLQDALLQPFGVVTGPTEMAYQLELVEAYAARGIVRPVPFHRLRPRCLRPEDADGLRAAGVDFDALTEDRPLEEIVPSTEAAEKVGELEQRAGGLTDWLRELADSDEASATLSKRVERLRRRLRGDLDKLSAAIEREWVGSAGERRRRVDSVRRWLWVKGVPAERVVSVLEFSRRHGGSLFDALGSGYDPYDERERWLVPKTAESPSLNRESP